MLAIREVHVFGDEKEVVPPPPVVAERGGGEGAEEAGSRGLDAFAQVRAPAFQSAGSEASPHRFFEALDQIKQEGASFGISNRSPDGPEQQREEHDEREKEADGRAISEGEEQGASR